MIAYPHGSVIFSDDVRQEANGKLIFIGVYQRDMWFDGPIPWSIAGLSCNVSYAEPFPEDGQYPSLEFIITRKDAGKPRQVLWSLQLRDLNVDAPAVVEPPDVEEDAIKMLNAVSGIRLGPMTFDGPSRLRVIMRRDDQEIFLGGLEIIARPAENQS